MFLKMLQGPIRLRNLVALCLITAMTTVLINIPSSALISLSGQSGLSVRSSEGSLWKGSFTGLSFQKHYLNRLDYTLRLKSIFLMTPHGDFSLSAPYMSAKGIIAGTDNGNWIIPLLNAVVDSQVNIGGQSQPITLAFEGQKLTFNDSFRCLDGQMIVRSRLTGGFVATVLPEGMSLNGNARCENEVIKITLESENTPLSVHISGLLNHTGLDGEFFIENNATLQQNIIFKNLLVQNGFRKQKNQWFAKIR